jgi:hypothetical protein
VTRSRRASSARYEHEAALTPRGQSRSREHRSAFGCLDEQSAQRFSASEVSSFVTGRCWSSMAGSGERVNQ